MNKEKVVQIPITEEQRKINENGNCCVPCQVTTKWLQFNSFAMDEKHLEVNIMTQREGKDPHKLGGLVLSKEDLLRAINSIYFYEDK